MFKDFGKRAISFLLAAVIVFSLVPVVPLTPWASEEQILHAHAATTVTVLDGQVSVTDSQNKITEKEGTVTITAQGGTFSSQTNNVTVTNETDSIATLTFTYTLTGIGTSALSGDSASCAGESKQNGTYTYTGMLDPDASVAMSIKHTGSGNVTLVLQDFSLVAAATSSNITFEYDSTLGGITVGGAAMANGGTQENVSLSEGVAVAATPANGAKFLGWINTKDNALLSTAASDTLVPTADMTVKAVFVGEGSKPWFMVGGLSTQTFKNGLLNLTGNTYYTVHSGAYLFDDLNAAAAKAAASTTKGVVLMNDGTLPAGTYTIPAGVTLLIPFDTANTLYTTAVQTEGVDPNNNDARRYTKPTAFRTLTMADGANLVINGAMSLSAKQALAHGSQTDGGSPSGPVSFVKMESGSNITVNNGGALYAYGFITGSGTVTASSGATVYECFQIMDFRGGNQSTDMQNGVFPLSQYYVQNIEVPLTLYAGATEHSYTSIYMSSTEFGSSVGFIGSSGAMFNLTSGSVTKYYDGSTDRLIVELNGKMSVSGISMSVGTSTLDSEDYELPVNNNITLRAKSGSTIVLGQDMALLPGSQIIVEQGATCTVNANVYVYDADQWGNYTSSLNKPFIPVTYAPGRTYDRTAADLVDASILVNGTVDSTNGYVYTTAGGANIYSTGTGKMILRPGTEDKTYQLIQNTGNVEIPITPAKLKNQNGTYLESAKDQSGNTYVYTDGFWCCETAHAWNAGEVTADPTCTTTGVKTFTCATCGKTKTETVAATGHADANTDHVCDNGCGVYQGSHADSNTDHECDYGCSELIGTHGDINKDHACDYGCSVAIGTCEDQDLDHACDHGCDQTFGTCEDVNKDHQCDYGCLEPAGTHEDTDQDHVCEYGCSVRIGEHADTDRDHDCDYGCAETIGQHADSENDGDHACDYGCGETLSECADADKNHKCDECSAEMGAHTDSENDGDHVCDYGCGETLNECLDSDSDQDHKCEECGKDGIGVHQWVDADCTTAKTCSVCNATEGEALGHRMIKTEAKEAACTTDGTNEYHTCSDCGLIFKDAQGQVETTVEAEFLPALGHDAGEGEVTTQPSCTADGVRTFTCSRCPATWKEAEAAPGHDIVYDAQQDPTCTEAGVAAGSHCSKCDYVTGNTEILALGHDWDKEGFIREGNEPTCTETGLRTFTCQREGCGVTEDREEAAIEHTMTKTEAKAVTCVTDGNNEYYTCSVCENVYKDEAGAAITTVEAETIPATGIHTDAAGDKDHLCDYGCGVNLTECADTDKNHACDECGAQVGAHADTDKDHACDYGCSVSIGTHEDTNQDHSCEYGCSVRIGQHADADHDHKCDYGCAESIGEHADSENDGDHVCDYGCGAALEDCSDKAGDKDHRCDVCGKENVSGHTYGDATCETASACTECGATTGSALGHIDENMDHKCDRDCGKTDMGTHADTTGDGDHTCDYCGETLTECADSNADTDHQCDECGKGGITEHQWVDASCTTPKTCSVCSVTDGKALDHAMTEASCSAPATCKRENCGYTVGQALPHTPVADEGYPAFCEETGRTDGSHCSVCGAILVRQEEIPALGHEIRQHEAKRPTYSSVGWEAYEDCARCAYTTYVEIPALEAPVIETYEDFLTNLALLEEIAYAYIQQNPGKNPANLVIKYIRTGVDRYNSGSWGIMAGYEDAEFAGFVSEMEDMINSQAEDQSQMICVTGMKNIENFTVPNGDYVDFGHMFGTMDITYHNNFSVNHADVAGWAGDLVDLLSTADRHAVSGTMDEMVADIAENYLNKPLDEGDIFSLTDMYGDLDGFYVMQMLQGKTYETGMLTGIIRDYFTESLTDEDRAECFLKNRLDGVSTRGDVRDAVYNAYTGNKVVAALEGTREFTADNLDDLKKACSYAFADYLCKLAGDFVDVTDNPYYSVFSSSASTLAPGITQKIEMATSADGKQMVYYLATADLSREDVHIFANYNNNDPGAGWAMQRVLDQANAAQAKYGDPNSEHYIENYNVIASINGAGFNMSTGEPSGLLIMNGVVYQDINASGFFGILKDGTAVIGTTEEYKTIYKDQVAEGIAGFGTTLVKDGKICITRTDSYYSDRASRTAVGITKTGKVVFMVLDGRQEPWSCGGSMEEIAQIMLEAGCVQAINLDGGGSTTFVAKQEGADTLSVVNRPSDGVERSVSTSLIMVSTAPNSTAFDHAILETETDYTTVGTSIQITSFGVSATGNAAEVPEGTTWAVSDEKWAAITEDGVFTALRNGDVDVYLMLGDEVIGSKTIHIVLPNQIYFTKTNINAVYRQSVTLPVKALYDGKEVAIRPGALIFAMNNEAAGVIDGFNFIADEAAGIKMVTITAALANDTSVSASVTLNLYKQGENSFDFDQAVGGDRELAWDRQVSNSTTDDAITYTIIDQNKDMVTSYVFAIDMTQIPIPQQLEDLIYMLPGSDMEGASAWSFLLQLAERVSVLSVVKPVFRFDPNFDVDYSELKLVNEYFVLTAAEFDEQTNSLSLTLNWIDQTQPIDPTMANPLCLVSGIKLTPKADAQWDAKSQLTVVNSGEISYEIYLRASGLYSFAQKPENQQTYGLYPYVNPNDANDKGGYFGDVYNTFEDTYTLVKAVKNGWVNEDGGFAYYDNGEQYFGVRKIDGLYYSFGERGINIGKTPYSGLFEENGSTYYAKNGELVTGWQAIGDDWYLFSWTTYAGVHGTYNTTIAGVAVTYEMDNGRLVKGHWHESEEGLQYFYGPYYYLEGMRKIAGETYYFEDGYACTGVYPVRGAHAVVATWYEFTDTGVLVGKAQDGLYWHGGYLYYVENADSTHYGLYYIDGAYYYFNEGGKAMVSQTFWITQTHDLLPVGTYRFAADGKIIMTTGVVNENGTLYYYLNGKRTNAGLVEHEGHYYYFISGAKAFTDGTTWVSETNGLVTVGTYRFAADGKMIMTTEIVDENGTLYYYCDGRRTPNAGIVIFNDYYYYIGGSAKAAVSQTIWVNITNDLVPVGKYTFGADGRMYLHHQILNGYYYYDSEKTAAGLVEIDGFYYYAGYNGKVVVSKSYWISQTNDLLPAGTYRFADDGKIIMTTEVVNENGTLYYYQNGKRTADAGVMIIDGSYYYVGSGAIVVTGKTAWVSVTNGLVPAGTYRFGEDGKMIMTTEIVNESGTLYYYRNGKRTGGAGLVSLNGDFYYIDGAAKAVVGKTAWVSITNGYVKEGSYIFDEEGKMVFADGIRDGYYYVGGQKVEAGLVMIDGFYYYAGYNGKIIKNQTYWITNSNGLLPVGTYRFDSEGKMLLTTGLVSENGKLYYYCNGKRTANAGVLEMDGNYYYIGAGAIAVTNGTAWVSDTNGLVTEGTYRFDSDGKMIMTTEVVDENGTLYYYCNGRRTAGAGLILFDGAYYYIDGAAKAVTNATVWVSITNDLLAEGSYTFAADGKMIL